MTEKTCTHCKLTKDISMFFCIKASPDGRMACCKVCKTAKIYAWRQENADKWREYVRLDQKKPHRAKIIAARRASPEAKERARLHERKESTRAVRKAYLLKNPERASVYNAKRSARRRSLVKHNIGSFSYDEWTTILARFKGSCAYCGKKPKRLTKDHVIPLSKGGEHAAKNIVPACSSCNAKKRAKHPIDFALENGRLCW